METASTGTAALPFAATSLLWSLYYQVDTAMLAVLSTEHDTGVYGAVYRFVDILRVLPRLIVVVAYPVLAVAWTKERTRFAAHADRLQRVVTAYGLPVLFLVVVWAAPLIGLVFGSSYSEGSDALAVLALGCYFAFHGALLVRVLNASGGERRVATSFLITVVANIILNALLIPRHGFFGAAVATLITELFCALLLTLACRRSGAMAGSGLPVAALGGAVLIGVIGLTRGGLWAGVMLAIALSCYFACHQAKKLAQWSDGPYGPKREAWEENPDWWKGSELPTATEPEVQPMDERRRQKAERRRRGEREKQAAIDAELDRILVRINSVGLKGLSAAERAVLRRASKDQRKVE